ncbi:MAG: hypothetical protein ABR543_01040 [Gemmatimonadaceae bacterium]
MDGSEAVREKFREVRFQLERLATTDRAKEFYPTLNAFLEAASSVLYVADHQFGLRGVKKSLIDRASRAERRGYDDWAAEEPTLMAVRNHPLTEERHEVVHRSGQAGFGYTPKPLGGLAVTDGGPFKTALFTTRGGVGLPLVDQNTFFYEDQHGNRRDAVEVCREYLGLVEAAFVQISATPWK